MSDTHSITPPVSPSTVVLTPPGFQTSESGTATEETYSAHFPLHDRADLVVRSSDGHLFAIQKFYLQVASPVFEDALRGDPGSERRDGRPVLQLTETGADLDLFLRFLKRDRFEDAWITNVNADYDVDLTVVCRLSPLIEKYATPTHNLLSYIVGLGFSLFMANRDDEDVPSTREMLQDDAFMDMSTLALGLIHEIPALITFASMIVLGTKVKAEGQSVYTHTNEKDPKERSDGWRYPGVEDIPDEFLDRLSTRQIKTLASILSKYSSKIGQSRDEAMDEMLEAFAVSRSPPVRS